ncbi:MAG: class I SAM-dependent methyltransferase [Thermoleophilaceae bacterium]|nr:class I SAM-dependent methyltransferase [Thermoleophilaceae bacterium]
MLDALSGVEVPEVCSAERIADVGAGAGFPGLVLAIELPGAQVDLVESARRKADLIGRLIEAAAIPNARPVRARAEEWAAGEGAGAYDVVTARAVGPLAVLAEYAAPLLREGGVLVAWKGTVSEEEDAGGRRAAVELGLAPRDPLAVKPFPEARDRRLYVYEKTGPTPSRYPRRPGIAGKRPL